MTVVRVRGIDAASNSRLLFVSGIPAARLAALLCRENWRFATLDEGGAPVGGVAFSCATLSRTWWAAQGNHDSEENA